MSNALPESIQVATKKSLIRYTNGFIISVISTLIVYGLVMTHKGNGHAVVSNNILTIVIALLAAIQCIVQLVFFLRLGHEAKPRMRVAAFVFMLVVVSILVIGSLWIMNNLNAHMMTPQAIKAYMQGQADGGF